MRRKRKLSGKGEKADIKGSIWSLLFFFFVLIYLLLSISPNYMIIKIFISMLFLVIFYWSIVA